MLTFSWLTKLTINWSRLKALYYVENNSCGMPIFSDSPDDLENQSEQEILGEHLSGAWGRVFPPNTIMNPMHWVHDPTTLHSVIMSRKHGDPILDIFILDSNTYT